MGSNTSNLNRKVESRESGRFLNPQVLGPASNLAYIEWNTDQHLQAAERLPFNAKRGTGTGIALYS
ncbi:hypothetical protein [Enhydrobacter aerosaccus]|uniref:hypothetical protein n=1 Tax=Enhydrobacter aerosaccus TaxID=225324 RepID=UPI0011173BD9|nr:hypothetical protein [Enhydrobacter aerosaccus]